MEQNSAGDHEGRALDGIARVLTITPSGVPLRKTTSPVNRDNLWRALFELFELLRFRHNQEAAYQAYFERNPIVFQVLGFDSHDSFEKSSGNSLPFDEERGFRPEPDFLCGNASSGVVTVFELKTPFVGNLITTRSSDGNRAKAREDLARHIAQAREYVSSIRGSAEARATIRQLLHLQRISDYRIALVCGLAEENDAARINEIFSGVDPSTSLLHYDVLLERLSHAYAQKHEGVESRVGWCFVYRISFADIQPNFRVFISDAGSLDGERVSLVREGEMLVFECVDAEGHLHRLTGRCMGTAAHYVHFEFSNDENGLYMSLRIDDEEHALVKGKSRLRCDPDLSNFTMGADLTGQRGAAFNMYETIFVNKTLALKDKLGLYAYSAEKDLASYLRYEAQSFMKSIPGAMIQDVEELKPIYVPTGHRVGRIDSKVPKNAPKPRINEEVSPSP